MEYELWWNLPESARKFISAAKVSTILVHLHSSNVWWYNGIYYMKGRDVHSTIEQLTLNICANQQHLLATENPTAT